MPTRGKKLLLDPELFEFEPHPEIDPMAAATNKLIMATLIVFEMFISSP
jgi:hypothetical protein